LRYINAYVAVVVGSNMSTDIDDCSRITLPHNTHIQDSSKKQQYAILWTVGWQMSSITVLLEQTSPRQRHISYQYFLFQETLV